MTLRTAAALLLTSTAVCMGCGKSVYPLNAAQIRTVFGDQVNYDIVRTPDRVEAYRVGGWKRVNSKTGAYEDLAGPIAVPKAMVARLGGIFGDRRTYDFKLAKGCIFDPGIRLRFVQGDEAVDVLLCFHCRELQVVRDGKRQGGEDFDNEEPALIAIAKQLFPDDEDIAAFKPQE